MTEHYVRLGPWRLRFALGAYEPIIDRFTLVLLQTQ